MDEDRRRAFLDTACIALLCIEWTVFGSMHFSALQQTIDQIPSVFPAKRAIAIVTGVMEVGTGLLMLVPAARTWAARASLFLLVILLPAMLWIVFVDSATHSMGSFSGLFRIVILPNNFLLALCSFRLSGLGRVRPLGRTRRVI